MSDNPVRAAIADPVALESLYRKDPRQFAVWLADAAKALPNSDVVKVWDARLNYVVARGGRRTQAKLLLAIGLSLLVFAFVRFPYSLSDERLWVLIRFAPVVLTAALGCYFLCFRPVTWSHRLLVAASLGLLAIPLLFLPFREDSSTVVMALIHLPLVLASVLACAYAGDDWRDLALRLAYLRYLGEGVFLSVLILLGGAVLSGMTFALFSLIGVWDEEWYIRNVASWGVVAAPVVATFVFDAVLERESGISVVIARVFTPLFLLMTVVYLVVMLVQRETPFYNRDLLIILNGLLALVWAMTVLSAVGWGVEKQGRLIVLASVCLVSTTLIIDGLALSAVVFRLFEFGITPNRIVVIGFNLLVFVHLVIIIVAQVREVADRGGDVTGWIACYLPIYSVWGLFVVVGLPPLFGFA